MSDKPQPKKILRLTIEVDGIWADDLDEEAGYLSEPDDPGPRDRLYVVTEEWMHPEVVLTIQTHGVEEADSMHAYRCRVVAAEAANRTAATEEP